MCPLSIGCSHNPVLLHDKLLCCNDDRNAERWDAKCDLPACVTSADLPLSKPQQVIWSYCE
jgi:hypothetical protein